MDQVGASRGGVVLPLLLSVALSACSTLPELPGLPRVQGPPLTESPVPPPLGAAGTAYVEYFWALGARDLDAAKRFVPREKLNRLANRRPPEILEELLAIQGFRLKTGSLRIVDGTLEQDRATLTARVEVVDLDPPNATGTIRMVREDGQWKILTERWDLGTPAGKPPTKPVVIPPGTDVNAKDSEGRTPAYRAAQAGDTAMLEALIRAGADVNARADANDYQTPLMIAVAAGQPESVRVLLRARAAANATDPDGRTALTHAAALNPWFVTSGRISEAAHVEMVEVLIAAGAWVDGPSRPTELAYNYGAITPLLEAAANGHTRVVRVLIKAGADVNRALIHKLSGEKAPGPTALMHAAGGGHREVAELLVEAGAKVNAIDSFGNSTALMYAADGGHKDIVEILLKAGADANAKDGVGNTAMAFGEFYPAVVEVLRAGGARDLPRPIARVHAQTNPETTGKARRQLEASGLRFDEDSFLQHAIRGDTEVVKLFLAAGMRPSTKALEYAIASNRSDTALTLIRAGAHPDARLGGITPLIRAASECHMKDVVHALVEAGANVDAKAPGGATPLESAKRCTDNLQVLRRAGAK